MIFEFTNRGDQEISAVKLWLVSSYSSLDDLVGQNHLIVEDGTHSLTVVDTTIFKPHFLMVMMPFVQQSNFMHRCGE